MWGLSATSVTNTFANFTVRVSTTGRTLRHNPCNFNGTQGRYLTVIYDNVRSNTIQFAVDEATTTTRPDSGTVPGVPQNVSLRVGGSSSNTTLVASWTPPANDGGSAITGYTVTISRPGRTFGPYNLSASARSRTINRPLQDTTYTVTVAAKNQHGPGPSARERLTTPAPDSGTVPGVPRNVSLRVGGSSSNTTLVASWTPPANDGGSAITGYTVTISRPGRTFGPYNLSASARSRTINRPLQDTTYTVTVAAKNQHGPGPSARERLTTPAPDSGTVPGVPRNVSLRVGGSSSNTTLVASWTPPANDGGSAITGYTVTISRPGRTFGPYNLSASARSRTINRPLQDTTYTVTVAAKNQHGPGPSARERLTTPAPDSGTVPGVPRNVSLRVGGSSSNTTLVASWTPPANDGGSAITGYTVTISRPGRTFGPYNLSASARSRTINRPLQDTTYTVTVAAKNQHGPGPSARERLTTPSRGRPTGEPRITKLEEHKPGFSASIFIDSDNDVTITWDTSSVQDADGYYVERRYIAYPTTTVTIRGKQLEFPDFDGKLTVEVGPSEGGTALDRRMVHGASVSRYRYPDVAIESFRDKGWILQFRVTPYNNIGEGRTSSDWVSLGTSEMLTEARKISPCRALEKFVTAYSLGSNAWGALKIVMMVLAGGALVSVALRVASLVVSSTTQTAIFNSLKAVAGCYADMAVDALGDMLPPLGWFMDATGLADQIKGIGCIYGTGTTITQENVLTIDLARSC